MPYHILKRVKLIHKGTSSYLPTFAIDLEEEKTWRIFKLYRDPSPDIQAQVIRLLNIDGTLIDKIEKPYVFTTHTTCNYGIGSDTIEKRILYLSGDLIRAYGIDENMVIELTLNDVIYHYDRFDEKVKIYEKTIEGPKDVNPVEKPKMETVVALDSESIKDQSKVLLDVIEKAKELDLDINWIISAVSLQLQEIAVLKCAKRANVKLDKNNLEQILNRKLREVEPYLSFKDQYDLLSSEIERQKQIRLPQLTGDLRAMRVRVLHQGYNPEPEETQVIAKFSIDLLGKLKTIA